MAKRGEGLLITENEQDFARLHEELKKQIRSMCVIEEHLTEDLAFILWEMRRLRRIRPELLNAAFSQAVRNLLKRASSRSDFRASPDFDYAIEDLARRWPTDRKARAKVSKLLGRLQLDESAIEAEALRICAEDYERIERVLALNTARRDKLLYLMAEGRDGLFKRLRGACDAVLEHETPQLVPSVACAS